MQKNLVKKTISHQRHISIYWTTMMITRRQDCYRTSNKRTYARILGSQRQKAKAYEDEDEGGNKRQHVLKNFNDHGDGEESEPDLSLLLSCRFQLEEFGRGHGRGRGRLSCGHLSWGLDSSSYQGTYFSSSYHDHPYPYLFPCPYPYHLSQIADEGCEIVRDRGRSDGKALPEVEYACRSAKRRTADSWPTETFFQLTRVRYNKIDFNYLDT